MLAGKTIETLAAAEHLAERYANAEALGYLNRALELTPNADAAGRFEIRVKREKIYELQGEVDAQAQDLAALDDLARVLDDPQRRAMALVRMAVFAISKSDYAESVVAAEQPVAFAEKAGNLRSEAEGLIAWGTALWKQANYAQAKAHIEQALELSRTAGQMDLEGSCLKNLGIIADLSGDRVPALAYFEQDLHIKRLMRDRDKEAQSLNNVGVVYWRMGKYAQAQDYFEQAIQIHREIGSRSSELFPLGNLAMIANAKGDYDRARAYAEQSLQLAREMGDRYAQSRTLGFIGNAYHSQGALQDACRAYQEAVELDQQTGDRQDEAHKLCNLGAVSVSLGDLARARIFYADALRISSEIGKRDVEMYARRGLALLHLYLGENHAARQYAEQAVQTSQEISDAHDQAQAWVYPGHARNALGDLSGARQAYQSATDLYGTADGLRIDVEPRAGLAQVALAQADTGAALEQVEVILKYLDSHSLEGTREPFWVYLTCYRVLLAAIDRRSRTVLQTVYEKFQSQAEKLDPGLRRSFLENVPHHRELNAAWIQAGLQTA